MHPRVLVSCSVLFAALLSCLGCATPNVGVDTIASPDSKLDAEQIAAKIEVGMTPEQVEEAVGPRSTSAQTMYEADDWTACLETWYYNDDSDPSRTVAVAFGYDPWVVAFVTVESHEVRD